jgi:hypothetical protein
VAGNPTMLHLLAGVNPEPLATYPFTPVFLEERQIDGLWRGMHNLRNAVPFCCHQFLDMLALTSRQD